MSMDVTLESYVSSAGDSVDREGRGPVGGRAKRLLDIVVAGGALMFFAPLMLLLTVLVRVSSRGPAFYSHSRIGYAGASFGCYKFRSMVPDGDRVLAELLAKDPEARAEWEATRKLRRDPRITAVGRFLRKTSLDELPQLFNILRGDMSVIGPRPVVTAELEKYGAHAEDYLRARPGLTGLWQISGRSDTGYDERVRLDVRYVRNWSFWSDIRIGLLTVPAVLLQKGSV